MMLRICLNSLILMLISFPVHSIAMTRLIDADGVVTIKNGNPCFSHPQDKEVIRNRYSLRSLDVVNATGGVVWEIDRFFYDENTLPEPNSVETCIEYGVLGRGMRVRQDAIPLQFEAPYRALMRLREAPDVGVYHKRSYMSAFCLTKNEQGEPIIVEATGGGRGEWRCLKPGESANGGFWGWLFGN